MEQAAERFVHGGPRRGMRGPRLLQPPGHLAGEGGATCLGLAIVGFDDLLGGVGEMVHRLVEPAIDAPLDEVQRGPEDDHRGHQPQEQQGEHELGAEARAENPAPSLHERLDEISHQERQERQDQEDVDQQEGPEEHLVGDVRPGEAGRLAQQGVAAHEHHEERQRARPDEAIDPYARDRLVLPVRVGWQGSSLPPDRSRRVPSRCPWATG